jgi:hypothetical protein
VTEPDGETDSETETETVELKLSADALKRRVAISVDGRGIEVEGPDPLLDIVTVAAELWKLTEPAADRPTFGFGSGATLYTEIAGQGDLLDREDT